MKKLLSFWVLISSSLGVAAVQKAATVHILSEAEVSGSRVTLAEIATISAADGKLEKQLRKIDLGEAPTEGKIFLWTAPEVSQRLQGYAELLRSAQVTIPEKLEVRKKDQRITEAKVQQRIADVVKSQLPDPSWEFEVGPVILAPVVKSLKPTEFQIIPPLSRPKGAFSFELLAIEHGLPKRFWVVSKIKYFATVAVLTRQVPSHSRFTSTDVQWVKKDITYMNDVPATSTETGRALARMTLSPGTVLLRSHLEREMALRFGDSVEVQVGGEDVSILTKGIAQQNGFIGDVVKVKSVATNKILDGVVVAPGVVNVRY